MSAFWLGCIVLVGFAALLNLWHQKYLARLSIQEKKKLETEERNEMNIW